MRKKNQTSGRPEEKLAYHMMKNHILNQKVIEEQKIITFDDIHFAKVDILLQTDPFKHYAIRLMGEKHDELKQKRHDRLQQYKLEERGYNVIDFWYHKMPILFLSRKKKLDEDELKVVWHEIAEQLYKYEIFLERFKYSESLQE